MKPAFRKVLITGGTRGIGRALAAELVARGSEVMVCGRDREALREAEQSLGVRGVAADVSTPAGVARLASAVRGELCGLDVLVNNAGVQCTQDVVSGLDRELAERELSLNLLAPMALTGALMPLLLSSPAGAVVNVSSALGFAPSPRSPVYAASKAGLTAWTHALRAQLAGTGVRVIEVVPPLVATDMTRGRQAGAISPERAVGAMLPGLTSGKRRIVIGKARLLSAIHRLCPALARKLMAEKG